MNNTVGIHILAKENLPENIEKLSAQREIYNCSKFVFLKK